MAKDAAEAAKEKHDVQIIYFACNYKKRLFSIDIFSVKW